MNETLNTVMSFVLHSIAYQFVINTCLGLLGGFKKELCGHYMISNSQSENADKQIPWASAAYSNASKLYSVINGNTSIGQKCIVKEKRNNPREG
jgi:hypothetical protein